MNHAQRLVLFLAFAGAAMPVLAADSAQDTEAGYTLWGVGRTGVMCVMAPCPWRGIFPISPSGERGFPLSRHDQPEAPAMSGDPVVTNTIAAAYSENRCLIVEARLDAGRLDVARIVGEC